MVVHYFTILETLPSGIPRDGVGHLFRRFVRIMGGQALDSFWNLSNQNCLFAPRNTVDALAMRSQENVKKLLETTWTLL